MKAAINRKFSLLLRSLVVSGGTVVIDLIRAKSIMSAELSAIEMLISLAQRTEKFICSINNKFCFFERKKTRSKKNANNGKHKQDQTVNVRGNTRPEKEKRWRKERKTKHRSQDVQQKEKKVNQDILIQTR